MDKVVIVCEDHWIDSGVPGLRLLLRNKRRVGAEPTPARTVLFVHGATYAATLTFDYSVDGQSWMDEMAGEGFDAWCIDLLGYGGSDRPPEMAEPPDAAPPLIDTAAAVGDLGRAVDFIRARRGLRRLSLIGYSWGTAICGAYAGAAPETVERLVLYGALWLKDVPSVIAGAGMPGAYRLVTAEAVAQRWILDLDPEQVAAVVPPGRIEAWAEAVIASDPEGPGHEAGCLRAPAGVVKDVIEHWSAGGPTYDPATIRAPTLVVMGEWDRETTPAQGAAVFERLRNAADRRYVVIGRGTHALLLENQRHALRRTVAGFLNEGR